MCSTLKAPSLDKLSVDIIFTVFIQEDTPSPPALSFKIEQNYFENNINDDGNNFVLDDGFYSRTIQQDQLVLAFDTTDDGKLFHRLLVDLSSKIFFSYHA